MADQANYIFNLKIILPPKSPSKNKLKKQIMPYLTLKYINFFDFKSFEGQVIVGPFCKSLNCVLGPNGAGKSNIIDGILFVFGKNARQMRTKHMNELIHNMGKVEKDSAYVELVFVEMQGRVQVPDSQFKIRRTVFRNSQTTYECNGKKVEKQFIQDLLTEKGIDMESDRYLVLQGEIEQLAMMKPRSGSYEDPGFLEYIEKVTGSTLYLDLIQKQEQKSATLLIEVQMMKEQHILLASDIDSICRQVEPLLHYFEIRTLKNRVTFIKNKVKENQYRKEMQKREENIFSKLKVVKREKERELDNVFGELCSLNDHIRNAEVKRESANQQIDIVRQQMGDIQEADNQERKKVKEVLSKIERQSRIITDSEQVLKNIQNDLQQNQTLAQNSETKLDELNEELNPVKQEVKQFDSQQDEQRSKLNEEIRQSDIILRGCTKNYNDQQRKCDLIQKEIQSTVIPDVSQLRMLNKDLQDNAETQSQVQKQIDMLREAQDKIQQELNIQKSQMVQENEQLKLIYEKIKQANQQVRKTQVHYNQGVDQDLETLQKLHSQNQIGKVHFRLCSAGQIEAKYETALNVAMGVGAQIIVMDTADEGFEMLAYLRINKIQTANLKVVPKQLDNKIMQQYETRQRESHIPGLIRLMSLIKFQETWVEPIFYKFLKNNYFCETIQQANAIRQNYQIKENIYTLRGEISKEKGDMKTAANYQKGYWKTSGEKLNVKENPNDQQEQLKYWEQQGVQIKSSIHKLKQKIEEIERDKGQVLAQLQIDEQKQIACIQLQEALEKKINDLTNQRHQIPVIKKKLADLETQMVEEQTKKKEFEQQLAIQNQIKAQLDKQLYDIDPPYIRQRRAQMVEIEKKITELEKIYRDSTSKINSCIKKNQNVEREVLTARQELKIQEQILQKCEHNFKQAEQQITELFKIVTEDVMEVEELDNQLSQLRKQKEQISIEHLQVQMTLAQINKELTEAQKLQKEQEDFVNQIESLDNKIMQDQMQLFQLFQRDSLEDVYNWEEYRTTDDDDEILKLQGGQVAEFMKLNREQQYRVQSIVSRLPESFKGLLTKRVDQWVTEEDLKIYQAHSGQIKSFMDSLNGNVLISKFDESRMEIYRQFISKFIQLKEQQRTIKNCLHASSKAGDEKKVLEKERLKVLVSGLMQISAKLYDYYRILSKGTGYASLEPINLSQLLNYGIDISVKPPGKPYRSISKLSGGEKTMASLALLFAVHFSHPNKVYFLDEIDAALDQANLTSLMSFLIAIAGQSQFIIVSHRQVVQDNCDKVFGVMKNNNQTLIIASNVPSSRQRLPKDVQEKIAEIKLRKLEEIRAKQQQNKDQETEGQEQQAKPSTLKQSQVANTDVDIVTNQLNNIYSKNKEVKFTQDPIERQKMIEELTNSSFQRSTPGEKVIQPSNAKTQLQSFQDGWKEDSDKEVDVQKQKAKASKKLKKRIARNKK